MEQQQSTKNTVSDRMSRVFTKKRTLGLAACLALVLIAGGGASYYHHAQERAAHAQERAALSELTAIQAEKMGVSVLSEAEVRSLAADAIGQEETAVTFDEISLMTGAPGEHFGKHGDKERVEHRKDQQDKHQKAHEGRDEAHRAAPPDERSGAPDGADGARPWHHGADGEAEHPGAPDGQPMKSGTPGGAPPQAPTDNAAPKNAQVHEEGQRPCRLRAQRQCRRAARRAVRAGSRRLARPVRSSRISSTARWAACTTRSRSTPCTGPSSRRASAPHADIARSAAPRAGEAARGTPLHGHGAPHPRKRGGTRRLAGSSSCYLAMLFCPSAPLPLTRRRTRSPRRCRACGRRADGIPGS